MSSRDAGRYVSVEPVQEDKDKPKTGFREGIKRLLGVEVGDPIREGFTMRLHRPDVPQPEAPPKPSLNDGALAFGEATLIEAADALTNGDVQQLLDGYVSPGRLRMSARRPGMPKSAPRGVLRADLIAVLDGRR